METKISANSAQLSHSLRYFLLCTLALTPLNTHAQWPTSFLDPMILSSGPDRVACDLQAQGDGGVMVVYDGTHEGQRRPNAQRFNAGGASLWTKTNVSDPGIEVTMLKLQATTGKSFIYFQYARGLTASFLPVYQAIDQAGNLGGVIGGSTINVEAALSGAGLKAQLFFVECYTNKIASYIPDAGPYLEANIGGAQARELAVQRTTADRSLIAFTKSLNQRADRSEVWLLPYTSAAPVAFGTNRAIHSAGTEKQFRPQITFMANNKFMVNWLGQIGNTRRLYGCTVNAQGSELSSGRSALNNVEDYIATTSTLGTPVFAAVTRTSDNPAEMDTLIGGLINPEVGEVAAIPVVSSPDIKIKALRQEENGDFSLIYSVPEDGTTLLKVRRISGTTASTMWETTVADLGIASDDKLKRYPNTFVSGGHDNVLFILTRYDQPYTQNTVFQLIRLQADGQMGGA